MDTGFLELLCLHSLSAELQENNVKTFVQVIFSSSAFTLKTTTPQDFEMKKLMWNMLFLLTFNDECLVALLQKGFLCVLLDYLDDQCWKSLPAIAKWSEQKLQELQVKV